MDDKKDHRYSRIELSRTRSQLRLLKSKLSFLVSASDALLEANIDGIECRDDEDCDHCVFMTALNEARVPHVPKSKASP